MNKGLGRVMKRCASRPAMLALGLLVLAGCSAERIYDSATALRVQQCAAYEPRERDECERKARASYGQYKKAREEPVTPASEPAAPPVNP